MSEYTLIHGDCLDILPTLEAGSIDAVICDPPYGTTACAWDSVIPFAPMWAGIKHVLKPKGAVALFGSQPFTSALVMSNPGWFKHEWIWNKKLAGGFAVAQYRPLSIVETISVFGNDSVTYNPEMRTGLTRLKGYSKNIGHDTSDNWKGLKAWGGRVNNQYFPTNILEFSNAVRDGLHPTQKPVALMEYLIRTYTNEGDTVLDFTMGSGTTGVAAMHTGRNLVGIEMDAGYFAIAKERIAKAAQMADGQFVTKAGKHTDFDALPMFAGVG